MDSVRAARPRCSLDTSGRFRFGGAGRPSLRTARPVSLVAVFLSYFFDDSKEILIQTATELRSLPTHRVSQTLQHPPADVMERRAGRQARKQGGQRQPARTAGARVCMGKGRRQEPNDARGNADADEDRCQQKHAPGRGSRRPVLRLPIASPWAHQLLPSHSPVPRDRRPGLSRCLLCAKKPRAMTPRCGARWPALRPYNPSSALGPMIQRPGSPGPGAVSFSARAA